MTERKPPSSWTTTAGLPAAARSVEHGLHRVGVDHEAPAQRGGIANAERDALVAEQEVGAIQAVVGDARVEGLLVVDRRRRLKPGRDTC